MCNNKEAGNAQMLLNPRDSDYGGETFWENEVWNKTLALKNR